MTQNKSCIYCSATFRPQSGEGDHVINASLGEFDKDVRFRGMCPECNSFFGRLEEVMVKACPESLFAQVVEPKRRRRGARGLRWQAAHGVRKPNARVHLHDDWQDVDFEGGTDKIAKPIDQLIFDLPSGKPRNLRLFPGISSATIEERLSKAGYVSGSQIRLACGDEHKSEFIDTIKACGFEVTEQMRSEVPENPYRMRAEFEGGKERLNAIAKIGFHYFLSRNALGVDGSEPTFKEIKRDLKSESVEHRVKQAGRALGKHRFDRLICRFDQGCPWGHLLWATVEAQRYVAYVSLFVSTQSNAPAYRIDLGGLPAGQMVAIPGFAHFYRYEDSRTDRFAGSVKEVSRLLALS